MAISHVALWTKDLERAAEFWLTYFDVTVGDAYHSKRREGFISRFVSFSSGASIELMMLPGLKVKPYLEDNLTGWAHIAVSLRSEEAVNKLANICKKENCLIHAPRKTGDGYYEAVISDPDGNLIEITS